MMVPRQIVSPQGNKPIIGIVQDTLLGCMKFTVRDTFLNREETFNILMAVDSWNGEVPVPCILKPEPLWSGKQIFSLIIPKINMLRTSNNHPDDEQSIMSVGDTQVRIESGDLLMGIIDKRTVGASPGSLIHIVWNECGPDATRRFLTECQKTVNHWILNNSFSVGIGDGIANDNCLVDIEQTILTAKSSVMDLIKSARMGKLDRQPGLVFLFSLVFFSLACILVVFLGRFLLFCMLSPLRLSFWCACDCFLFLLSVPSR